MKIKRGSGLLMHITSLPGENGIGTMGKEAYDFVDLLKEGGQHYWQVLPFGPVSSLFGFSPYSSFSSFAGNFMFINMDMLQKETWMRNYIISDLPALDKTDFVDFNNVAATKVPLLEKAAENFFKYADNTAKTEFTDFCKTSSYWLDDYAMFMAVAGHYNNNNWLTWDKDIRHKKSSAVEKRKKELLPVFDYHRFVQFVFYKQWRLLKEYANKKGIKIIGDIPIYVNFDGADAWSHSDIFQLDPETFSPTRVSGVPPDYFSPTGQRWGNPLYKWWDKDKLNKNTLNWWLHRFQHMFQHFDITRLDHFRGLESYWAIPSSETTAVNGVWEKGPGVDFFKFMKKELGKLPIIAEDLGIITTPVEKLRDAFDFPGMKILQFAFDFNHKNLYLPHNYITTNCVVYTGTHDNNTTNGWFYEQDIDERTRQYVMDYLRLRHMDEFHWELIDLALRSVADLAIIPVQDVLGYAGKFRMNTPGQAADNWHWKLTPGRLTHGVIHKIKKMTAMYNRT